MSKNVDESTALEKFTVAMTAFGFSCIAFFLAVSVLVPATGSLFQSLPVPEGLTMIVVLAELLGLPIVGALLGIHIAVRPIRRRLAASVEAS